MTEAMIEPDADRTDPVRRRCPHCGRSFDCGAHTRPFTCWCAAMPGLPAGGQPAAEPRCLCPECLADELARRASDDAQSPAGQDR